MANRLKPDDILNTLLSKLPKGYRHSSDGHHAVRIVRRREPGDDAGTPVYVPVGDGILPREFELIADTSLSVEHAAQRVFDRVIKGVMPGETMTPAMANLFQEELQKAITRIRAELVEANAIAITGNSAVRTIEVVEAQEPQQAIVEEQPTLEGLQPSKKPQKKPKPTKAEIEADEAEVLRRAELLGMEPKRTKNGKIHAYWPFAVNAAWNKAVKEGQMQTASEPQIG